PIRSGRKVLQLRGSQVIQRQSRKPGHVRRIYKISPGSAWREAERQGVYRGSDDDLRDGFIHFSSLTQLAETARKHFLGQAGFLLIEVDADALARRCDGKLRATATCFLIFTGNLI